MESVNFLTSACRYCRYYKPEGRRGGQCDQLGVPVRGSWKACSLGTPAFTPSWRNLERIVIWQEEETPVLQETLSLDSSLESSLADSSESKASLILNRQ